MRTENRTAEIHRQSRKAGSQTKMTPERLLQIKLLTAQLAIGKGAEISTAFEKGILTESDRLELIEFYERKGEKTSAEYFRKVRRV